MMEEVQGTIDWAKSKLDSIPKAKKDLSPLLDALSRKWRSFRIMVCLINGFVEPLTQIVGGVALLLGGVLNLLGKLVRSSSPNSNCVYLYYYSSAALV